MLCPKCGRMLPDGVPCPCGAPLRSTNPAVNLIKTLGVSAKLLAAAVLYSAVVFLGLLSLLGVGAVTSPLYYIGASGAITPEDFEELVRAMDQATGLSGILFAAPAALSAAALWLFYAACRNRKTGNVSTAGLTIFQVMAYIQLAVYCLLACLPSPGVGDIFRGFILFHAGNPLLCERGKLRCCTTANGDRHVSAFDPYDGRLLRPLDRFCGLCR